MSSMDALVLGGVSRCQSYAGLSCGRTTIWHLSLYPHAAPLTFSDPVSDPGSHVPPGKQKYLGRRGNLLAGGPGLRRRRKPRTTFPGCCGLSTDNIARWLAALLSAAHLADPAYLHCLCTVAMNRGS